MRSIRPNLSPVNDCIRAELKLHAHPVELPYLIMPLRSLFHCVLKKEGLRTVGCERRTDRDTVRFVIGVTHNSIMRS
jgi:hypothetical protein